MTSEELQNEAAELQKLLQGLLSAEWKRIIEDADNLLQDTGSPTRSA
jgi:hypothetical protein